MNTVCAIVMHSTYNKHGLCDVMHRIYKETACPVKVGQAAFSGEHFPERTEVLKTVPLRGKSGDPVSKIEGNQLIK